MSLTKLIYFMLVFYLNQVHCMNLDYLDPLKLQTIISAEKQTQQATSVILSIENRLVNFSVTVDPKLFSDHKDVFKLKTVGNKLHISASSGVAAVWGYNYYLKKYCKSHIGWQVRNIKYIPQLPQVDETVISNDRFRYYQNVCTVSYSFVWWNEDDWRAHIRWMALNGINMALAPMGQEVVWLELFQELGMTEDEINEHFTGPAFLSWLRMGNMRGWAGPLSLNWHERTKRIQKVIIENMLNLGIVPVLPAFAGHVPRAFARLYPNVTFHKVVKWCNFDDDYCCPLYIDPEDSLFKEIGSKFLQKVKETYGVYHIYNSDPFNEIKVSDWSEKFVVNVANNIHASITEVDNEGVWLLQNWMFVNAPSDWELPMVKSFLTAIPNGRVLVLDLQSEQFPKYQLYQMYFGQPFIWCMLHNFGGTMGMSGDMQSINSVVYEARELINSTMIGVGLTPEGIHQNYVVYELMLESAWRKEPVKDMDVWVADYAERRYGCNATSRAWRYLLKSVYSFYGSIPMHGEYVFVKRPSFDHKPWAWYKSHDLFEAWKEFILAQNQCNSDGFRHDLTDVTRQALQYRAEQLYVNLKNGLNSGIAITNASMHQFLDVLRDMQVVLEKNEDFSIKYWLTKAKEAGSTEGESMLFEINARNQITLWGPNGEISDYACKQWAEVFKYYYIPRWQMFFDLYLQEKLRGQPFKTNVAQNLIRSSVEKNFATVNLTYSSSEDMDVNFYLNMYRKWYILPSTNDLPHDSLCLKEEERRVTVPDKNEADFEESNNNPSVILIASTTPI